jgi:hypothetical protein
MSFILITYVLHYIFSTGLAEDELQQINKQKNIIYY